ncbi:stalk domain-containing protein [Fenollaria massiliensis]|uniref:Stalk domain-containing protein n=1 Tax=Fenollaria massiliensis TaxID=938288 RepID=A0A9E7DIT8_9FIRM|nr:stalk domain-containing protein [Fenollaria massiliensis]UQK58738.1 stalk domain-containing protein [Fenollaria massiliensis]
MKELKRIILLAMVLILCISLLPVNQNLLKAEAQLDDSTKLNNIKVRVYDGEKWDNAELNPKFDPNNREYTINLDIKYKKIQFYFEKASDDQVIEATDQNKCPLRDSNYTEEYVLRPQDNYFNFYVKSSSSTKDRDYFFDVKKGLEKNAHKVEATNGNYRDLPRAFKGDIVKLKGQTFYGGKVFDRWIADTHNVELERPDRILNEFIMPDSEVKFSAQFKDGSDDGSKLRYIIVHAMKDNAWETFYDAVKIKDDTKEYELNLSEGYTDFYLTLQTEDYILSLDKNSLVESNEHINTQVNGTALKIVNCQYGFKTEESTLKDGENILTISIKSKNERSTSNYTLKINNGEVKYNVTIDPNNNSTDAPIVEKIKKGEEIELPDCTFTAPEGKEFKAWEVDGEEYQAKEKIKINKETTIKAIWKDKTTEKFIVTINPNNNGKNESKTEEIKKGEDFELPKCTFTAPEGKEFKAWEVDGQEKSIGDKIVIDKETTVTAIWKAKPVAPKPEDENKKYEIKLTQASNGKITINPTEAKEGELVTVQAVPDYGYELESILILDENQKLVPMIANQFKMPKGAVSIYVKFRELAPAIYPKTEEEKPIENKRHRRDWYYKNHNEEKNPNEEEKFIEEKEIKADETKAIITIGSQTLEKVMNGVRTVKNMDSAPYIKRGRTMLPLRYLAEALGYKVFWLNETRTVLITDIGLRVEIPIDTNLIIVNGIKYTSDVKPEIVHHRTMLPIANIARALGLKDGEDILWDEVNRQVTINKKSNK